MLIHTILLTIGIVMVSGIVSAAIPPLQPYEIPGELTMVLPAGWSVDNFQCWGISITNPVDPTYGISFLNKLHQYPNMLPLGTTPEQYVEQYLSQDLELGGKTVTDVQILGYEDVDLSAISAFGSVNPKAMRVSLKINNVPVIASLTIGTYDVVFGTSLAYLWGFYGPEYSITEDGPSMKMVFDSIRYDDDYLGECRRITDWGKDN
ncbi:MAG TPA: hypothetical protein VN372_05500 [Methanospirillum sp.]|nr:hypothetical protein [Methanospirillum sp.]